MSANQIPAVVFEKVAESPYERFIVEKWYLGGQKGCTVFSMDEASIMTEFGDLLPCWNALSPDQQHRLIQGNTGPPIRRPEGDGQCMGWGHVLVETVWDEKPGPRFYCLPCAIDYLICKYLPEDGLPPVETIRVKGDVL